jgi:hypothetical protein
MLESVERIFQAAHTSVLTMQDGERMQVKQLTQTVSVAVGIDPKNVLPFVNHYVHNTDLVYVTRGKNGGIIRGKRPEKVTSQKLESSGV